MRHGLRGDQRPERRRGGDRKCVRGVPAQYDYSPPQRASAAIDLVFSSFSPSAMAILYRLKDGLSLATHHAIALRERLQSDAAGLVRIRAELQPGGFQYLLIPPGNFGERCDVLRQQD